MEMETQIERIARTRLEADELRRLRAHSKEITERMVKLDKILKDFKETFKEYLPLLDEAGIKYSAHFNDPRYEYQGSYIQFEMQRTDKQPHVAKIMGPKVLKMDFDNGMSYRYEYVPYNSRVNDGICGKSVYGNWPKKDLILFIYNGLFK